MVHKNVPKDVVHDKAERKTWLEADVKEHSTFILFTHALRSVFRSV